MTRLRWYEECAIALRIGALLAVLAGELGLNCARACLFAVHRRRTRAAIHGVLFG